MTRKSSEKEVFGKVYKVVLDDGLAYTNVVAIKRLNPESKQGVGEFKAEIKMLSKCRHCHLVNLVGYCNEHHEMILVYEYMSCKTLADRLYKYLDASPLTWEQRIEIGIGVARGLDYLHNCIDYSERVFHLDVKSDNILLDENLVAKISDLGFSKIVPANQAEVIVDHLRGTHGYIDPFYIKSLKISSKTDVYAFGVVLLELLTSKRVQGNLANWINVHISNGSLDQNIDPHIVYQIDPDCKRLFANTIIKSLHNDPTKRPSMSKMVAQLEVALELQNGTNQ